MTQNKLTPDIDYGFAIYMIRNSLDSVDSLRDVDGIEKAVLEIEKYDYYPAYVQVNEMLEPKDQTYGEKRTIEASEYKSIKPYSQRSDVPGFRNDMKSFFFLDDIINVSLWDEGYLAEKGILLIDDGVLYLEIPDFLYKENPEIWDILAYRIKKALEPKSEKKQEV